MFRLGLPSGSMMSMANSVSLSGVVVVSRTETVIDRGPVKVGALFIILRSIHIV